MSLLTPAGSVCARRSSSVELRPMRPQVGQSPRPSRRPWQFEQCTSNAACGRKRPSSWASVMSVCASTAMSSSLCGSPGAEHHRLLLGVALDGLHTVLLAEARLLGAAERELVIRDLDVVDPGVARVQLLRSLARFGHVLSEDR